MWLLEEAQACPRCGTVEEEREDLIADAYRCLTCEKIDIEKEAWAEGGNVKGVSIRLYPKSSARPPISFD